MMNGEQTMYRPTGRVVTRRIGADNLLVPVSGGVAGENVVFPVNDTGLFIWERLSAGKTIDEIAKELSKAFDVDSFQSLEDCNDYLSQLLEQNLLEKAEH